MTNSLKKFIIYYLLASLEKIVAWAEGSSSNLFYWTTKSLHAYTKNEGSDLFLMKGNFWKKIGLKWWLSTMSWTVTCLCPMTDNVIHSRFERYLIELNITRARISDGKDGVPPKPERKAKRNENCCHNFLLPVHCMKLLPPTHPFPKQAHWGVQIQAWGKV